MYRDRKQQEEEEDYDEDKVTYGEHGVIEASKSVSSGVGVSRQQSETVDSTLHYRRARNTLWNNKSRYEQVFVFYLK